MVSFLAPVLRTTDSAWISSLCVNGFVEKLIWCFTKYESNERDNKDWGLITGSEKKQKLTKEINRKDIFYYM